MNIPKYLSDIFQDKVKANISFINSGSYSIGFLIEFLDNYPNIPKKLFMKIIPIIEFKCENDITFNYYKSLHIIASKKTSYENEVKVQRDLYKKTTDYPICMRIYNDFIITNDKVISFIKKLAKFEKKCININTIANSLIINEDKISLGIIIMDYCNGTSGFLKFKNFYSQKASFGAFFISKKIKDYILRKENELSIFFYLIQIIYIVTYMFRLGIIHNDLHLGNIMIDESQICSNKAYNSDGSINNNFVGRIYIIDFGSACNETLTDKYIKNIKSVSENETRENIEFSKIINILGRKIILDGYDFNKKIFANKWYVYDWFINLFFNKDIMEINKDIVDNMELLVNNFQENIVINNENIIKEKKCFCFW